MKITNIDSFIEEFRNGRDKWSRTAIELVVREIERLRNETHKLKGRLAASENDLVLFEVSEMLKKTQARVQELEQERRWIPVGERLPEKEQEVLVSYGNGNWVLSAYMYDGKWYDIPYDSPIDPTHWQPLPKPPQ